MTWIGFNTFQVLQDVISFGNRNGGENRQILPLPRIIIIKFKYGKWFPFFLPRKRIITGGGWKILEKITYFRFFVLPFFSV